MGSLILKIEEGMPSSCENKLKLNLFFAVVLLLNSTNLFAQRDTMHLKSQYVLNNSYTLFGQIDFSNIEGRENDTRLAYGIKLRGHKFLINKFCIGVGIKYWDFYYSKNTGLDLDKPWNGEFYSRYYPFKAFYIESCILYGGFVRDSLFLNKTNWLGAVGIGFETRIKGNLFLELDIKAYYPIEKDSWVKKFGQEGIGFIGINYYFRKRKNFK